MNIASTPFLFLFLPAVIGMYYLLPCRKGMGLRNLFLLAVSLFFYAWGEPVYVFLLLGLILLVWLLGKMAEHGQARGDRVDSGRSGGDRADSGRTDSGRTGDGQAKGGRLLGKWAVALTVMLCVGMLMCFKHLSALFAAAGLLLGKDLSFMPVTLPVGMAFFCFHAISYVVDIYRGQCHSPTRIFHTALYLSVFYKMMQGPIVTYREFEPQIEHRTSSWNDVCEGLWRFTIGFGKKMIIATNLYDIVKIAFMPEMSMAAAASATAVTDSLTLTVADAWIGCAVFMVFMYFDFSGYSDMAIGLGRVFGFKTPENFNYPYISTSIAEYWRRWHITLISWFRDYLYYPILLGPSVRFRKYLLRHNVDTSLAKTLQNIFVPACVWIVTALWHGTNWNYTLWGLINCAVIVAEPHIKLFGGCRFGQHLGPLCRNRMDTALRWLGTMLLLLLMVPLICTEDLSGAGHYLRIMFGGGGALAVSPLMLSSLRVCWVFLVIGVIGCFPVVPAIKRGRWRAFLPSVKRCVSGDGGRTRVPSVKWPSDGWRMVAWNVCEMVLMIVILVFSLAYLFKSGTVWFMYQQ